MTLTAAINIGLKIVDVLWLAANRRKRAEARERRAMEAMLKADRDCERVNRQFRERIMKKTTRIDLTAAGLQHCLDEAQSAIDENKENRERNDDFCLHAQNWGAGVNGIAGDNGSSN